MVLMTAVLLVLPLAMAAPPAPMTWPTCAPRSDRLLDGGLPTWRPTGCPPHGPLAGDRLGGVLE